MLLLSAMTDITLRDCHESSWDGLKNGEEQKCKSARVLWHRQDVVLSNFIGCNFFCVQFIAFDYLVSFLKYLGESYTHTSAQLTTLYSQQRVSNETKSDFAEI